MIGQKQSKKLEVGFSEQSNVFYVKPKDHNLPKQFKTLINCPEKLFNDFLNYLEKLTDNEEPKFYTFQEMENVLNQFLIKKAKNCKVVGNYEVKAAS